MPISFLFTWLRARGRPGKAPGPAPAYDHSWRKYSSELLQQLNPAIDFNTVASIFEIGWCGDDPVTAARLLQLIRAGELARIPLLDNTIAYGMDELGAVPIGNYLRTYCWQMANGDRMIQVIGGSFDGNETRIRYQQSGAAPYPVTTETARLIYPVA